MTGQASSSRKDSKKFPGEHCFDESPKVVEQSFKSVKLGKNSNGRIGNTTFNYNVCHHKGSIAESSKRQLTFDERCQAMFNENEIKKMLPLPPNLLPPQTKDISPLLTQKVLSSAFFQLPMEKPPRTLVLHGIPGVGKTTTVIGVIDELRKRKVTVAFAFFHHNMKYVHEAAKIMLLLIKQLLDILNEDSDKTRYERCMNHVQQLLREAGDLSTDLDEIRPVLKNVIVENTSPVCIILDALDEFSDPDELVRLLNELKQIQIETNVSVIMTERSGESSCEECFKQQDGNRATMELRADRADINQYIVCRVERMPGNWLRKHRLREELLKDLQDVVQAAAKGIFLLARLFTEYICGMKTLLDLKAAQEAVKDLSKAPPGHSKTDDDLAYVDRIVGKAIEGQLSPLREAEQDSVYQDYAQAAFRFVRDACRPLSKEELEIALAVRRSRMPDPSKEDILQWGDLQKHCHGLLVLDEFGCVEFLHYSIYLGLRRRDTRKRLPPAHADLGRTCVVHLCLDRFSDGPCKNGNELGERLARYPFMNYAARYWAHHFHHVRPRDGESSLSEEAAAFSRAAVKFLKGRINVDCAWQIMQWNDKVKLARVPNNGVGFSILGQDGPNPVKFANPYAANGITGLHLASFYGFHTLVSELLKDEHSKSNMRPQSIDQEDFGGRTPLYMASYAKHESVVEILLKKNSDPNHGDKNMVMPLQCAADSGSVEVVKLLLAKGADVNKYSEISSENAMYGLRLADWHIQGLAEMTHSVWHRTALHCAARKGHNHIVKALLADKKIKATTMDSDGMTPLHKAAKYGHLETVKILLEHIPPSTQTEIPPNGTESAIIHSLEGCTALHLASMEGKIGVVGYLLKHFPKLCNARDFRQQTALHYAAFYHRIDALLLLLEHDHMDVGAADEDGHPAVFTAVMNRHRASGRAHAAFELLWKHSKVSKKLTPDQRKGILEEANARRLMRIADVIRKGKTYSSTTAIEPSASARKYSPLNTVKTNGNSASTEMVLRRGFDSIDDLESTPPGSMTPIPEIYYYADTGEMLYRNTVYPMEFEYNTLKDSTTLQLDRASSPDEKKRRRRKT